MFMFRGLYVLTVLAACVSSARAAEPRFTSQTIDDAIRIGYGVVVGEVDGDGRPDILLADARQIVWYRNPGERGKPWTKHIMAENLTPRDNVCIAARDLDGDGKVEVAVGANWNPGETSDREKSGSVHVLLRPDDPTQKWDVITLEHDPTVHRMRFARVGENGAFQLCVLPLHGVGNRNGEGESVKLLLYDVPEGDATRDAAAWKLTRVDTGLHLTHNFDVGQARRDDVSLEVLLIGGRENGVLYSAQLDDVRPMHLPDFSGAGEVRFGRLTFPMFATIEPMHGHQVVAYIQGRTVTHLEGGRFRVGVGRQVLDETLHQGHGIASTDLLALGHDQIVAGWRNPNAEGKVGIRLYVPHDDTGRTWTTYTLTNDIACEDLTVADLDGDGKPEIIAAGRATRNVMVLWNDN